MYLYCYVCSVSCILFHCDVLCTVCVYMCTVLLPQGVNPTAVNKYLISYHISYHIISYIINMYVFIPTQQCLLFNLDTSFCHLAHHQAINNNPLYSSYFDKIKPSHSLLIKTT